jgi:hypothetical protein
MVYIGCNPYVYNTAVTPKLYIKVYMREVSGPQTISRWDSLGHPFDVLHVCRQIHTEAKLPLFGLNEFRGKYSKWFRVN